MPDIINNSYICAYVRARVLFFLTGISMNDEYQHFCYQVGSFISACEFHFSVDTNAHICNKGPCLHSQWKLHQMPQKQRKFCKRHHKSEKCTLEVQESYCESHCNQSESAIQMVREWLKEDNKNGIEVYLNKIVKAVKGNGRGESKNEQIIQSIAGEKEVFNFPRSFTASDKARLHCINV